MTDSLSRAGARNGCLFAASLAAFVLAVPSAQADPGQTPSANVEVYAKQCPRWARLAEDLIPFEGNVPQECTLVSQKPDGYTYQAAPNIEVDVLLKAGGPLENVRVRDLKSHASVTYNAEALALLK